MSKLQPSILRSVWIWAAVILLASCGSAGGRLASADQVATSPPSLGRCVWQWNHASLGEGAEAARVDAFKGNAALMLRFPDGACGLAFPRARVAAGEQQREPMVDFLHGNYYMRWSPLGHVSSSEIAVLQADAHKQVNVFVRRSNGHVVARPHAHIVVAPANVFVSEPGCEHVVVPKYPVTGRYEVLRSDVACVVVRTLAWAWPVLVESASKMGKPPTNTISIAINGWQCVGSTWVQGLTPRTYERIVCRRGRNVLELKDLATRALFSAFVGD